jgi:formylglycine-generating enzyme required for sulfatase activity
VDPAADRVGVEGGQPEWPVFSVRHADATAYAEQQGARLPLEDEWEKMARGVDGRTYPWGDRFDATLCSNLFFHRDNASPTALGAFPTDVSVYGVRDVGGSMRSWCADPTFDGSPERAPMRGGCWNGPAGLSRCASRFGHRRESAESYVGARLVRYLSPR